MRARCTAAWGGRNLVLAVLAASPALISVRARGAEPVRLGISSAVFTIQATNEAGTGS